MEMIESRENFQVCYKKCNALLKSSKLAVASNKNITWWDNQIKKEMSSIKSTDLTYKEVVMKRRMERKKFQQSKISLLSNKSTSSKINLSKTKISRDTLRNENFAETLNKFVNTPKDDACIWRQNERSVSFSPSNKYDKIANQMKKYFYDFYSYNFEDEDKNIEEILTKLITIDTDLLPLLKAIKVTNRFLKYCQDLSHKRLKSLKAMRNDMITHLIHRDIRALQVKKRTIAFGKTIAFQKCEPSNYDFRIKYINIVHTRPVLESFQAVWEDILDLETTKKFCAWLMKHPHIEPPVYLVEQGRLEPHSTLKDKSADLMLVKNLEGYDDMMEPFEFYEMFSGSAVSDDSSESTTGTTSSLVSLDISNIKVVI